MSHPSSTTACSIPGRPASYSHALVGTTHECNLRLTSHCISGTATSCSAPKAAVCELPLDPTWHEYGTFKYAHIKIALPWHAARESCIALGGGGADLADFASEEELTFVLDKVVHNHPMPMWIGCHAPAITSYFEQYDELDDSNFGLRRMRWSRTGGKCAHPAVGESESHYSAFEKPGKGKPALWEINELCTQLNAGSTVPFRWRAHSAAVLCQQPRPYVCKAPAPAEAPDWKIHGDYKYYYSRSNPNPAGKPVEIPP